MSTQPKIFSLKKRANTNSLRLVQEAADICSNLFSDPDFFTGAIRRVLKDVANALREGPPTDEEAEAIKNSLSMEIGFDGDEHSYMTCEAGAGKIFISQAVVS